MDTNTIRATSRATDRAVKLSPATRDPYRRLAAGILANGATAAKAGDTGAAQWLLSEQAQFLSDAVGLSYTHVQRWARDHAQI